MTLQLYTSDGWLNMPAIIESEQPFKFIAAGRGTGKTYGAIRYYIQEKKQIMLLRRTQTEAELQMDPDGCSYYEPAADLGVTYSISKAGKNNARVYIDDEPAAFIAGLSTFANIRGAFNFRNITDIFYDEFIPEPHVKKIKDEGFALANLYESVNRNRELSGSDPVRMLCAANSMNLANDTFIYFGLIHDAEEMLRTGEEVRIIDDKLLIIPQHSPISERKRSTALYKNVSEEFSKMALNNDFVLNDFTYVNKKVMREYNAWIRVGDLYIWKHKSNKEFFVTMQPAQVSKIYGSGYADLRRFQRDHWRLAGHYQDGRIRFSDYYSLALFEKYFNIK